MKIHTRNLVQLIKETVGTPQYGVEVGVFRGENSESLLQTFAPSLHLLMIDTWREWEEGTSYETDHKKMGRLKQSEWDEIREEAQKRVWDRKATVFVGTSEEGALWAQREKQKYDFVFIDANHTFKALTRDIAVWLPLVRSGGLLCGHDYGGPYHDVAKAVNAALGKDRILKRGGRIWGYVKE